MNLGLLRTVNISDIELALNTRARESYGILADLARNIEEHGLIHPIVVYSPNGEVPYKLVAGARRFYACSQILKWEEISCRIYDTPMTEQELKAIELYENVMRLNLTAMEEAKLRTQLHETMQEIHGVKTTSSPGGHSIEDTAKLTGVNRRTIERDIKVTRAARAKPELKLDEEKTVAAALRKLVAEEGSTEAALRKVEAEKKRRAAAARKVETEAAPRQLTPDEQKMAADAMRKLEEAYGPREPTKFVPSSPQTLTANEWTEMVRAGMNQEWNEDKFESIVQQLGTRQSEGATRKELRELVKLLNITIGA